MDCTVRTNETVSYSYRVFLRSRNHLHSNEDCLDVNGINEEKKYVA